MICENCESVWWSAAAENLVRDQAPCQECGSGLLVAVGDEQHDAPSLPLAA